MSDVEVVRSKDAEVHFRGSRCIHSRNCVLGRPDVFVPNVDGEWIHPENATAEEVAELAHNCPSGAIEYARLDGGKEETPPVVNLVRIRENGPYAFHAELVIEGHENVGYRRVLCRCGASQNKPFCDGSHHASGFKATGEANSGEMATLAARNGAQRRAQDHAAAQRIAQDRRLARNRLGYRRDACQNAEDVSLPLRTFVEQAVLRRHSRKDRLHRGLISISRRSLRVVSACRISR
ncbi:MAG TPA: (4Fe-4S)-binding protein [Rhodanobacteraceae bacterium]|jgi:uncharacterized Fe-S cluster protein YjdI/CDGSH-type Zn-finger protein|nr:(4Fe-4S)-binding protein [Rhodanobacteraceae bacterium]